MQTDTSFYAGGSSGATGGWIGFLSQSGATSSYNWGGGTYAIYGNNNFLCNNGSYIVYSDERIKTPFEGAWDDLAILNSLTVRRFTYKDKLRYIDEYASAGGSNAIARVKVGFFAQEVKEVLPEAISVYSDTVPDIQVLSTFSGSNINWYGSNINVGDTIHLVNEYYNSSNGGVWGFDAKVLAVTTSNITIDAGEKITGSNVYVYGRKVDDFLGLNQDTISAVTVGAVQRLSQLVDAQNIIIESLTSNVALLTARITALEG